MLLIEVVSAFEPKSNCRSESELLTGDTSRDNYSPEGVFCAAIYLGCSKLMTLVNVSL